MIKNPYYLCFTNHKSRNIDFIRCVNIGTRVLVKIENAKENMLIYGFVTSISLRGIDINTELRIGNRFVKWHNVKWIENEIGGKG
jgi:hypothetical protein